MEWNEKTPLFDGFAFFTTKDGIGLWIREEHGFACGFDGAIQPKASDCVGYRVWHLSLPPKTKNPADVGAVALSASLAVLCEAVAHMAYGLFGADAMYHMLFAPHLMLPEARPHGAGLGCTFSPRVRSWGRGVGNRFLPEVQQAMYGTFNALWELSEEIDEFRAFVQDGYRFTLSVPGFCPCLGSDPERNDSNEPIMVSCHNVDIPLQQLSLFVGLVKLTELIERDLHS